MKALKDISKISKHCPISSAAISAIIFCKITAQLHPSLKQQTFKMAREKRPPRLLGAPLPPPPRQRSPRPPVSPQASPSISQMPIKPIGTVSAADGEASDLASQAPHLQSKPAKRKTRAATKAEEEAARSPSPSPQPPALSSSLLRVTGTRRFPKWEYNFGEEHLRMLWSGPLMENPFKPEPHQVQAFRIRMVVDGTPNACSALRSLLKVD